jgi:hypothetical protein
MSSSQHPIALSIERQVDDGATRLLAVVMLLPLVDGIFAALVLAGALDTWTGVLEVGLLVFGGSATVAIVLAEMDKGPRAATKTATLVGVPVVVGAVVVAALAPTLGAVLSLATFERFAAVVILAVAAKTASARLGEWLPRPAVIVGLGLVASVDPGNASLVLALEPALLARAALAGLVGAGFAIAVAATGPWLRNAVDIDRFRFGSAVALGVLPLGFLGVIPGNAPVALAVLGVTALLSLDPQRARRAEDEYRPDRVDLTAAFADGGASQGVGHDDAASEPHKAVPYGAEEAADEDDYEGERLPWL